MALTGFENMIKGMQAFNPHEQFTDIVESNATELADLQREQLSFGKDITGKDRIDEYRPLTKYLKAKYGHGLGAVTDRVTFFMTGNLYQSLTTKLTGDVFETTSPLPTFEKMVTRIGNDDYGLDEQQRIRFATETAMPEFRKRFKEITGLTMSKV